MLEKFIDKDLITQQFQNFTIARPIIQAELQGIFGSATLQDFREIINLYNYYENGVKFEATGNGDYTPSEHRYKTVKTLIDKEARFMFSIAPTINITDDKSDVDDRVVPNQTLVQKVLYENHFESRLVRAAKDCLIGKRIAIAVDFNDKGINISIMPSLEFIYETDPSDIDKMTKFIRFYSVVENKEKEQQQVYKKKWELNEEDGFVYITEEIYNGKGEVLETITPRTKTDFKKIPVKVIINGGLIGDPYGVSDIESLLEDEEWYNKLTAKDFDSLQKGADQIVYAMDVNPKATENISRSAGAFWDLGTAPDVPEGRQGQIGTVENNMSYSGALDTSLNRLRASMYATLDVPDTTSEALQGIISSGKTMKAIYWGLLVRCDEKMLDWKPALVEMIQIIIEGAKLYPNAKNNYVTEELVDDYSVVIDNSYPILEDEDEEKMTNINEVNAYVMSRKAYMKKWYNMNDTEVQAELEQIALERSMLEQDNYFPDDNGVIE